MGWKGIHLSYADTIRYCEIEHCTSTPIVCAAPANFGENEVVIENNIIRNNSILEMWGTIGGGGIGCWYNSCPIIRNNIICNNFISAQDGGGICVAYGAKPTIENNIIVNNHTLNRGGGIFVIEASPILRNNTIAYNKAGSGGGIYCYANASPTISNSIIWGNVSGIEDQIYLSKFSVPELQYNDIEGGKNSIKGDTFSGIYEHNIEEYPGFVAPSSGAGLDYDGLLADWHLYIDSPCIDSGNPNDPVGDEPFPHGYRVNIGAYGGTNEAQLTSGLSLTAIPDPMDFGSVQAGRNSDLILYLKNGSTGSVNIINISSSDPAHFGLQNKKIILDSGEIETLQVTFTPDPNSVNFYHANIIISSNELPDYEIPVKGYGYLGTLINMPLVSGTWTADNGPYLIENDIEVANGMSLIIEPGVEVIFRGKYFLKVGENATLIANGTESEEITFTCADTAEGWLGLDFISSGEDDELSYCDISYGRANGSSPHNYGGAIYCENSSPKIQCNIIHHNYASEAGGGICVLSSSPLIASNIICNNYAYNSGGGGIFCQVCSPIIVNNIIVNNRGFSGGGIKCNVNCCPKIINNTISNNISNYGGGLFCDNNSKPEILNSIIYGNTAMFEGQQICLDYGSDPNFFWNDIQGGETHFGLVGTGSVFNGAYANNIDTDPIFVDPSSGAGTDYDGISADWHLQRSSPCIDAGDPSYPMDADDIDIDGNPRIIGNRIDIGADEYVYP